MKEKSIINQVKALLGMEVSFETLPLENGTNIEAEAFEVGYEVFIVSDEDRIALPVGDYTLEDGRMLVVSEEGVIGSIGEMAEPEVEAEPAAETEVEASEEKVEMSADVVREIVLSVIAELGLQKVEASEEEKDETNEEKVEASKVEMSADDMPAATAIKPNAEKQPKQENIKLSNNRNRSTFDKTLAKISNL